MRTWKGWISSAVTAILLVSIPFNTMSSTAYAETVPIDVTNQGTTINSATSAASTGQNNTSSSEGTVSTSTETTTTGEGSTSTTTPPNTAQPTETPASTPTPTPSTPETKPPIQMPKTYEEQRRVVQDAIAKFQKDLTMDNAMTAIDTFLLLPSLDQYPKAGYQGDKNEFSNTLIAAIQKLPNKEEQADLLMYYATKAVDLLEKKMNGYDYDVAKKLVVLLPEGSERTFLATRMQTVANELFKDKGGYIDWSNPPSDITYTPYVPPKDPPKTNTGGNTGGNTQPNPPAEPKYDMSLVNYKTINGACYKITDHYKKSKIVDTTKALAQGSETVFCSVSTSGGNGSNGNYANYEPVTGTVTKGYDPYQALIDANKNASDNKDGNSSNAVSSLTIQYTIDKDSESPYYVDTGVSISNDKTMSYDVAKDALHQLSIVARGKYVEDQGQALALIDGTIILVKNEGKNIVFDDFAKMLAPTSLKVRALDTRSGKQVALADIVESKGISSIDVKGKELKLSVSPIVDNSIVLFPIEEIVKALGGQVTNTKEQTTIEFGKNRLIYTDDKSIISVNGKDVDIKVAIRTNKNGSRLAPLQSILNASESTLEIDSSTSKVYIK